MTHKKGLCVLLVSAFLMLLGAPAHGTEVRSLSPQIVPQTKRIKYKCFPKKRIIVLNHIQKETKRRIIITSGHRTHGRRKSLHRSCKAADIRVSGYSSQRLKAIARRAPGIGGIGTYRRQPGLIHVDVGSRREWNY